MNMERLKQTISDAINRIPNWNNSLITMEARPTENEHGVMLAPSEDATVFFGNDTENSPLFTLFVNDGKLVIDDVFEMDDFEDFGGPTIASDYFNLVNEIRNPGASQKTKILTLYTARPIKDREYYLQNQTLHKGTFLTSSYGESRNIGMEIPGEDKIRDVWKVRINSRDVIIHYDGGSSKHYQVISDRPEVTSMRLIDRGDDT